MSQQRKRLVLDWVILPAIAAILVGFSFYLWYLERAEALLRIDETAELTAQAIARDSEARFADIGQALRRLAARAAPTTERTAEAWGEDAAFYLRAFEGLAMLAWIDPSYAVGQLLPADRAASLIGRSAQELQVSASSVLLWQAAREEGVFEGFVVGEVDLRRFMAPAVETVGELYSLELTNSGETVLTGGGYSKAKPVVMTFELADAAVLTLTVTPTGKAVRGALTEARSTLLVALFVSALVVFAAYLSRFRRRVMAQERLRSQWKTFESVLDGIPQAIYVVDPETYEVLFANQFLKDVLGVDPVGGVCYNVLQGLSAPCSLCTDVRHLESDVPHSWEHYNPKHNRHLLLTDRLIEWPGRARARLEIAVDITQLKEAEANKLALEARLRQTQKLESIGTLASGVAHEINNPLMAVMNYAELLSDIPAPEKIRRYTESIVREGQRVADIVKNLLSFARQDKEAHSLADIKDIVDASLTLIGAVLRKDQILMEVDVPEDLPKVTCRSQQIQQVLVNLFTNARDALNARYAGFDEDKRVSVVVRPFERNGSAWVRTTVEDHGIGIAEGRLARIFDPFYTTKRRDRGTGLGLSVSYGIVTEHRGELRVESEEGRYTRFHVDLPIHSDESTREG